MKQSQNLSNSYRQGPDERGHFGLYGGRYVAETLMPLILEVEKAYAAAKADPGFKKELDYYLEHYAGHPSPLYFAERLTKHFGGAKVYFKREELNHTGSHKINNCLGQILLARRMGKKRIIAETGAGQHGVAVATVSALFNLPCTVYMGSVDIERQKPNVFRMRLLGAEVKPALSGSRTLKDAMNEALRDWVTNVEDTFYIIGTAAGPHPYPAMVRDFQSIIGRETRAQMQKAEGRLPDTLVACIGGGSNAIGLFHEFLDDASVKMYGVEAGGHGLDTGKHAASLNGGAPGVLHGNRTYLLQNDDGQITEADSISAGLDYPGIGPEHSWLHDSKRVTYVSATDQEALDAFQLCSKMEGIIPALEPAHALAYVTKIAPKLPKDHLLVMNMCGRGDKDIFTVAEKLGMKDMNRIDQRFAALKQKNQAGFVAFITAGDPDEATSLALMKALPKAGVDIIELGVAFTDPMADGPAIQAADLRALASGITLAKTLNMVREFRKTDSTTPVVLMGYYNPVYRYGAEKFATEAAQSGADGLIVVDLPPEEDEELRAPAKTAGLHVIRLATPTTNEARLPTVLKDSGGFLYYVSITGITGAARPDEDKVRAAIQRIQKSTALPVAVGFGVKDAAFAAAIARTADAVVVGSAIVQQVEELAAKKTPTAQLVEKVSAFVETLTRATHEARGKAAA